MRQRKGQTASSGEKKNGSNRSKQLPAQDGPTSSSFSLTSLLVHLFFLLFYTYVHVWGALALSEAAKDHKLNFKYNPLKSLSYATIQNLYIQTAYCALAVICDVVPASKLKVKLENVRSFLFTTLAFPLSLIVVVGYWGMLAMDRGLLYDERALAVMKYIPPTLNHCWHTAVGVAIFVEVLLVANRHPSHRTALTTSLLLVSAYTTEVLCVFCVTDFVPYPFMRQLGVSGMAAFFALTLPVFLTFYYLGRLLSYLRWGQKCLQTT